MKKFVIVTASIIGLFIAGIFFYLNELVKSSLEKYGQEILQTKVSVEAANILPFSGKGSLKGLKIANIPGFTAENIFSLDLISLELDIKSLFSDVVVIKSVTISSPLIVFETNPAGSNIDAMKKRIISKENSAKQSEVAYNTTDKAEYGKKIIIEKVIITKTRVQLGIDVMATAVNHDIELPTIIISDIGKKSNGTDISNAGNIILSALIREIHNSGIHLKAAAGAVKNIITDTPVNILKGVGKSGIGIVKGIGDGLNAITGANQE